MVSYKVYGPAPAYANKGGLVFKKKCVAALVESIDSLVVSSTL